jgi:hypothetical protein
MPQGRPLFGDHCGSDGPRRGRDWAFALGLNQRARRREHGNDVAPKVTPIVSERLFSEGPAERWPFPGLETEHPGAPVAPSPELGRQPDP